MPEQVEPRIAVAGALLEIGACGFRVAPLAPRIADRRSLRAEPTARVKQRALVGAPRQRLEFELTMDVDQDLAQLAQRL